VLNAERAIFLAFALVAWRALSVMTVHAVVVDTTTVVCSNVAAEVALILYVGFMMLFAIS